MMTSIFLIFTTLAYFLRVNKEIKRKKHKVIDKADSDVVKQYLIEQGR